jgi:ABC-type transport system involved in multi-copper enzyme maturation permease subunit
MTLRAMVYKETLMLLRSRRARGLLLGYLGLLALVVLWNWPSSQVLTLAGVTAQRMLYIVGMGQLVLLLATLPGLTAGSVIAERESGRLATLQATRLSPVVILFGKWLGSVLFALILMVCSLPLVMLCQVLGTLELGLVVEIYAHLIVTIFWAGMIGLAVSALARTGYGALMTTYATIIAVSTLTIIPTLLGFGGYWPEVARNLSPLGSMVSVLTPDVWQLLVEPAGTPGVMTVYSAFCLGGAVLAGMVAWWQLRRPDQPRAHRRSRVIDDRREIIERKLVFPWYLIDPQRRRRHIGNWINPVLSRELRSRMLGKGTVFLRVFFAMAIFSLVLTLYAVMRTDATIVDSVRVVVIASQVILIGLVAPPLTAPAISRERELNTLDILRMSRIGPWRLAMGKWYYALMISASILVAAVPMWFVIFKMQRVPPEAIGQAIAVVVAALLGGTLAGLAASSLCRRTGTATGVGYLLTVGVLFGTLVPVLFSSSLSAGLRSRLLELNPIVASVRSVSMSMFANLVGPEAWLSALVFLLVSAVLFLVLAIWRTRQLYRLH